jgi:Fe-S-cluster-containing dehydrogenase component
LYIEPGNEEPQSGEGAGNTDRIGVASKCDFCCDRVDSGLARGLEPGQDSDATPACVVSCSGNALHFGDFGDPDSVVSRLIQENEVVRLQLELDTDPSICYIPTLCRCEAEESDAVPE